MNMTLGVVKYATKKIWLFYHKTAKLINFASKKSSVTIGHWITKQNKCYAGQFNFSQMNVFFDLENLFHILLLKEQSRLSRE